MSTGKRPTGPKAAKRRHLKRQLVKRDGASCFYCGTRFATLRAATLDHLIPYSVWPTWRQANLVLACHPCNQAKADRLPQTFLRPSGFGPGLVPAPSRTLARTVRRAVRWTVRTVADTASWSMSWTVSSLLSLPLPDRPATPRKDRRRTVPAAPEVIECGRCGQTCHRDQLDEQPARWLVARPPVRAAYCWRCAASIADELLSGVAS